MVQQCEAKRIQQNSAARAADIAKQALDTAKADHLACLGPEAQGNALLGDAKPAMDKIAKDAEAIVYMENFVLAQLNREVANGQTMSVLSDSANEESDRVKKEIDALKTEIRTEKRRFLDSSPSATTAVGGMYFTGQPDNQVLIAFLSCFGAFLLFSGLLVLMNHVPIPMIQMISQDAKLRIVSTVWVVSIVAMYLGFFMFT